MLMLAENKEHLLGIYFTHHNIIYKSKSSVPIDREGMFSVEMTALLPSEVVIMNKSNSTLNTNIGSKNEFGSIDKKVIISPDIYEVNKISSNEKKKGDLPYVFIYMHIKEDGGRELVLKSLLSFRNYTKRTLHLSIRYGYAQCDISLRPDEDFNVFISLFTFPNFNISLSLLT
jgi:hypothetical protein